MRPLIQLGQVLALGLLVGCGSSGITADDDGRDSANVDQNGDITLEDNSIKDSGDADWSGTDLSHTDISTDWAVFGDSCSGNQDCPNGFCLELYTGKSVCTVFCIEECPDNWICRGIDTGPDYSFICVPTTGKLCQPCESDDDCQFAGDLCLDMGESGRFCGTDCSKLDVCPENYECKTIADNNGVGLGKQCFPTTGSCECTPDVNGTTRDCSNTNTFGTCSGVQTCDGPFGWTDCSALVPAEETCNGLDDDCDGPVDEGLEPSPCEVSNEHGTCSGTQSCLGSQGWLCSAATPEPESCDKMDNNCNELIDEGFPDTDVDGEGDCEDNDDDGDGVPDAIDNCPLAANPLQGNLDGDTQGDACDLDDDGDMVEDGLDNCPIHYNPSQEDQDLDGIGNTCDVDKDSDGLVDYLDNCPDIANSDQTNSDTDGIGDACDNDDDNDLVPDDGDNSGDPTDSPCPSSVLSNCDDNCRLTYNPAQADNDEDGIGDLCDDDIDGDGQLNELDCKPWDKSIFSGQLEICNGLDDNCNTQVDEGFADFDDDDLADCIDPDDDNDYDPDITDCEPLNPAIGSLAGELCNGYDDNCDGSGDEGCPPVTLTLLQTGGISSGSDGMYMGSFMVVTPGPVSESESIGYRIEWNVIR